MRRKPTLVGPEIPPERLISSVEISLDGIATIQALQIQKAIQSGQIFCLEGDDTYMFFNPKALKAVAYTGNTPTELFIYTSATNFVNGLKICFLSRKNFMAGNELDKLPEGFKAYLLNNVKLLA